MSRVRALAAVPLPRCVAGWRAPAARLAEVARYGVAGLGFTALNASVVIAADQAGVGYAPGWLAAYVLVTPLAYLWHARVTFRAPPSLAGLGRYALAGLLGFTASLALLALLCSGLGLRVPPATAVTTGAMFVWNYGWARWAVRRRPAPAV